jgi:hypothetical protein
VDVDSQDRIDEFDAISQIIQRRPVLKTALQRIETTVGSHPAPKTTGKRFLDLRR